MNIIEGVDFEHWPDVKMFTLEEAMQFTALTKYDFVSCATPCNSNFVVIKVGTCRSRFDNAILERECVAIMHQKAVMI